MPKMMKVDGYEIEDIDIWILNGEIQQAAKPPKSWDYTLQKNVVDTRYVKTKNKIMSMVLRPTKISGGNTYECFVTLFDELSQKSVRMRYEDFLFTLQKLGIQNNYITGTFSYRRHYGVYVTPLFRD